MRSCSSSCGYSIYGSCLRTLSRNVYNPSSERSFFLPFDDSRCQRNIPHKPISVNEFFEKSKLSYLFGLDRPQNVRTNPIFPQTCVKSRHCKINQVANSAQPTLAQIILSSRMLATIYSSRRDRSSPKDDESLRYLAQDRPQPNPLIHPKKPDLMGVDVLAILMRLGRKMKSELVARASPRC